MLMSAVILVAAIVMYFFPSLCWLDPVLAYAFLTCNVFSTVEVFKQSISFVMGSASH